MKHDIYIALIALSTGWGMHASLAKRFCLRCKSRSFALNTMLYGTTRKNNFLRNFLIASGLQIYLGAAFIEIVQVWGWKTTMKVASEILKGIRNAKR